MPGIQSIDFLSVMETLKKEIQPVSEYIRDAFGRIRIDHAVEKSKNSLVSQVDIEAEKMLVIVLSRLIPEAGFVTEEGTIESKKERFYWVIDPLDGTSNFLFGIPMVSISIALKEEGITKLGLIHHINTGDTYWAIKGAGSFKNNSPVHVSQRFSLSEAMVATGFPYNPEPFLEKQMELIKYFVQNSRGVRRLGSAAIDLAYLAEGVFDIYFEIGLSEWDTSAGMLLVREAGGIVTDLNGNMEYEEGIDIIACTPPLFEEVQALFQ